MITTLPGGVFRDSVYDPTEFLELGCSVMSVYDYYTRITLDPRRAEVPLDPLVYPEGIPTEVKDAIERRRRWSGYPDTAWDPQAPINHVWFVVVKEPGRTDNVFTSDSHLVKSLTVPMRYLYGHDNHTLHQIRFDAMLTQFPDATPGQGSTTGTITLNGRPLALGVAGHMINTMLASHVWVVDFRDRMNLIRANVETWAGRPNEEWLSMYKQRVPGEPGTNPRKLWHNYWEYRLGVDVYRLLCERLQWTPNEVLISYVLSHLNSLKREYPTFETSKSHFTS
uniref:Uncharacterized protein n=1 Tax=viral metagenome TaxID=1070528 RepID=A0A2V0RMA5_9ZZZZ